jgi:hypothetical protein
MSTANTVNRLEDRAGVPMTISNPQLQLAEELLQETIPPIKALQNLFDYATNISKLSSPPISELRREEKRGSELSQNRRLRKIDQFPTHSPSVYPPVPNVSQIFNKSHNSKGMLLDTLASAQPG